MFDNVADAHRILREITLLRLLKHPDIVEIKHIMLPADPNTFKDLYVVFELMEVGSGKRDLLVAHAGPWGCSASVSAPLPCPAAPWDIRSSLPQATPLRVTYATTDRHLRSSAAAVHSKGFSSGSCARRLDFSSLVTTPMTVCEGYVDHVQHCRFFCAIANTHISCVQNYKPILNVKAIEPEIFHTRPILRPAAAPRSQHCMSHTPFPRPAPTVRFAHGHRRE